LFHDITSFNIEPLPAALFGGHRAVIFAAVLRGPSDLADGLAGPHRPDLHHFAAFASPILLRGLVCALGVHVVLSALAAVTPYNALVHVYLPFSRLTGRVGIIAYSVLTLCPIYHREELLSIPFS